MNEIVFATKNKGKIREAAAFFEGRGIRILSLDDAGIDIDVIEDGTTFEANAAKKALAASNAINGPAMADDSGLVVDALGGAPGVDSAYFMGEHTPYEVRNNKILELMAGLPDSERAARFVCVIAIALPGKDLITARGELEGQIARKPAGSNGFGYDPIFYLPNLGLTTAQLDTSKKNKISHRGRAFLQITNYELLITNY